MKKLLDREWIQAESYRNVPEKQTLYVTTKALKAFLNCFNIKM